MLVIVVMILVETGLGEGGGVSGNRHKTYEILFKTNASTFQRERLFSAWIN